MFGALEEDSRNSFGGMENSQSQSLSQLSYSSDVYEKVEAVVEYEWPLDSGHDYFIEEYLANYLEIKSIRRSYPTVERRRIQTLDEREYLLEKGFVKGLQCDLGVVVIAAEEVYKVIAPDYKRKFDIYGDVKRERHYQTVVNACWKDNLFASQESSAVMTSEELKSAAVKTCASWNAWNNKRTQLYRETLKHLRTGMCQKRMEIVSSDNGQGHLGYFPVATLPGQFGDYVPRFSPEHLHHLPLNTVLKGPAVSADSSSLRGSEDDMEDSQNESTMSESGEAYCCNLNIEDQLSLSGFSTVNSEIDSISTSSSTVTCTISEFDSDFYSSCDSFTHLM